MDRGLFIRNLVAGIATLAAAIILKWSLFDLMLVYWFEMSFSAVAGTLRSFSILNCGQKRKKKSVDIAIALFMLVIFLVNVAPLLLFSLIFVFNATGQWEQMPKEFPDLVAYAIGRADLWIPSLLLFANYERGRKNSAVSNWIEPFAAGFERLLLFLFVLIVGWIGRGGFGMNQGHAATLFVIFLVVLFKSLLDSVSDDRVIFLKPDKPASAKGRP